MQNPSFCKRELQFSHLKKTEAREQTSLYQDDPSSWQHVYLLLEKMSHRPNEAQDQITAKRKLFYNTMAFFFKTTIKQSMNLQNKRHMKRCLASYVEEQRTTSSFLLTYYNPRSSREIKKKVTLFSNYA